MAAPGTRTDLRMGKHVHGSGGMGEQFQCSDIEWGSDTVGWQPRLVHVYRLVQRNVRCRHGHACDAPVDMHSEGGLLGHRREDALSVFVAEYLDDLLHAVYLSPPADADWSRGSDKPPHQ